ncbi:alpha/beta hydrolase-fold protein [uncultured Kordia sp.]|uniref:alpha/beta hydrolase-fold protein n=1 Tax=uncultured Kordia sp. TaxID=507699 RepID=UPI002611691C|nr:alpha/beta hydrolase-fold protein [uncultured Kordia sp.]
MKKIYIIFVLCCFFNNVCGQHNESIVIGKTDSIYSKVLNETREIWIHVPDGIYDGSLQKKKYPVLYLLDGNSHFHAVVGMINQLSPTNGDAICPKMIIVGILNTNRTRDLTPTKPTEKQSNVSRDKMENSGGGKAFMSFIETELIPYIDSKYKTESYRMFIGHSLGGLTVMNTFIHKPELFNAYVAIDPSMWWNNKNLLRKIKQTKFDEKYSNTSLFLAIANTMSKEMDTIKVKKDTTDATQHIRAILELNAVLNKDTLHNVSYKGKYYKDDSHSSIPLIATYDALRHIFGFYRMHITKRDLMNPKNDVLGEIKKYYQRLSKEFKRDIKPKQYYIEDLAYQLIEMKQFKKAEAFLKLNVANYPEDFYVYSSLADFYIEIGNKEKAIENFKKSNAVHKNSYATEQLQKIEKQ